MGTSDVGVAGQSDIKLFECAIVTSYAFVFVDGDWFNCFSKLLAEEFDDCWVSVSIIVVGDAAVAAADDEDDWYWRLGTILICTAWSSVNDEFIVCSDFLFVSDNDEIVDVVVNVVEEEIDDDEGVTWSVVTLLLFADGFIKIGVNSGGTSRSSGSVRDANSFLRSFVWRISDATCWLMDELIRFSVEDVSCNSRIQDSHWSIISSKERNLKIIYM